MQVLVEQGANGDALTATISVSRAASAAAWCDPVAPTAKER